MWYDSKSLKVFGDWLPCRGFEVTGSIFELILDCRFGGFGGDATASGRLSWLERGGHCFEPIRKDRGLSQNQALF